jgi:hypothetical protein
MFHQPRSLARLLAAALAVAAIAPATAAAAPAIEGQGIAAGGGPGVTSLQDLTAPDQVDRESRASAPKSLAAPDQVDRVTSEASPAGPPQWPANPRSIPPAQTAAPAASPDDGVDVGVLLAIAGMALVAAAGIGLAGRKRLRTVRQRQLA